VLASSCCSLMTHVPAELGTATLRSTCGNGSALEAELAAQLNRLCYRRSTRLQSASIGLSRRKLDIRLGRSPMLPVKLVQRIS
jgi:hypothetical protein